MRYLIAFTLLLLLLKCANQTSPGGGPQDKKPPELVSSNPKNNQRNFKDKSIQLQFDEYVKLKNTTDGFVITPTIGKKLNIQATKNKLIITPEKTLEENTTYSLSFQDVIEDITESNAISNLQLAFSTGPEIDSLHISGTIEELFKEEKAKNITVAIYSSDTFNIFEHQPSYITKTNDQGLFSINNLKASSYYIYAFADKNKNIKVEKSGEKIGFLTQPINVQKNIDSLHLSLFLIDNKPIKVISMRSSENVTTIKLNKEITDLKMLSKNRKDYINTFGQKRDELIFYKISTDFPDSIKLSLSLEDSILNHVDTTLYLKFIKTKMPKEKFNITIKKPFFNIENDSLKIEGSINKPIKTITYDSLYIQLDSVSFQPIKQSEIKLDTLNRKITIQTSIPLKKTTLEKPTKTKLTKILLIQGKSSFISIDNDSSSAKIHTIDIPNTEELGTLTISVETTEPNYIIQLYQHNEIIKSIKNIKTYNFKNLFPQEYKIRIIIDTNQNGKWDAGIYEKKKEPEKVILYKNFDGKYGIPIRANWEVGPLKIKF